MVPSMIDARFGRAPPAGDPLPMDPDLRAALGRIFCWLLEGQRVSQVGLRLLVFVHAHRPDLIGGISFEEISQMAGFGRSAAHNISTDLERLWPVGPTRLSRSARARRAYRLSHHRNGQGPGSGKVNHFPAAPPWPNQATPSGQPRLKA